jgi:hypothetical protein
MYFISIFRTKNRQILQIRKKEKVSYVCYSSITHILVIKINIVTFRCITLPSYECVLRLVNALQINCFLCNIHVTCAISLWTGYVIPGD